MMLACHAHHHDLDNGPCLHWRCRSPILLTPAPSNVPFPGDKDPANGRQYLQLFIIYEVNLQQLHDIWSWVSCVHDRQDC